MSVFFLENKYEIIRDAITPELSKFIYTEMKMNEKLNCYLNNHKITDYKFADPQCPEYNYSSNNDIFSESLMLYMKEKIEKIVGKELLPTYTYSRIYYKGAELIKHTDRESCEYTATVCIKTSEKRWNIYLEDLNKNEVCADLNETDMLVFQGAELPHWRNKFEHEEQVQIFLHYVDKNGKYSDHMYDKRPFIGYKNINETNRVYETNTTSTTSEIYEIIQQKKLLILTIFAALIIIFAYYKLYCV